MLEAGLHRLSGQAEALDTPKNPPPLPIGWPSTRQPSDRSGLLLTEEDLLIDFPVQPLAVIALRADTLGSHLVQRFRAGALEDALARAAEHLPTAEVSSQAAPVDEVAAWAKRCGLEQLWVAFAPVGYVRDRLQALDAALAEAGISLVPFVREYDRLVWPHCSKGFFQLRKRIPELLDALAEADQKAGQLIAGEE